MTQQIYQTTPSHQIACGIFFIYLRAAANSENFHSIKLHFFFSIFMATEMHPHKLHMRPENFQVAIKLPQQLVQSRVV